MKRRKLLRLALVTFLFFCFLKGGTTVYHLMWNETTKCFVSSATNHEIKVINPAFGEWREKITGSTKVDKCSTTVQLLITLSLVRFFHFILQIWSMDSDQPVHTLKVNSVCLSLAWRTNGKTDSGGGIDAARKKKDNFIISW